MAAAVEVFADRSLVHEPGTAFAYSTYGYTLLGRLIEVAAGQDYETYMQTNIWDVVGMANTGVEKAGEVYANHSAHYIRRKNGKLKQYDPTNLSNRIPGGGFYSTAEDLVKFGHAILNHTLLSDTTTAMMLTLPSVAKKGSPYAMGWSFYGPVGQEELVVGHAGEQTGCAAQLMIHREKNIVVVVMTNTGRAWEHVVGITVQLFPLAYKAMP